MNEWQLAAQRQRLAEQIDEHFLEQDEQMIPTSPRRQGLSDDAIRGLCFLSFGILMFVCGAIVGHGFGLVRGMGL